MTSLSYELSAFVSRERLVHVFHLNLVLNAARVGFQSKFRSPSLVTASELLAGFFKPEIASSN